MASYVVAEQSVRRGKPQVATRNACHGYGCRRFQGFACLTKPRTDPTLPIYEEPTSAIRINRCSPVAVFRSTQLAYGSRVRRSLRDVVKCCSVCKSDSGRSHVKPVSASCSDHSEHICRRELVRLIPIAGSLR